MIEEETEKDTVLSDVINHHKGNWKGYEKSNELDPYWRRHKEISLEGKVLVMRERMIIPFVLRKIYLEKLHAGHLGVSKNISLARCHVWWPGIDQDIKKYGYEYPS